MTVDLEAIARRGRCDVSNLQLALPLLQQGYSPPFLARYRRDELGGADETSLWLLAAAVGEENAIAVRRDELVNLWQQTPLADPAIGHALRKSNSTRVLERIARRLKLESSDRVDPAMRLAVRVLNPQKGDGSDLNALAAGVEGIDDATKAVEGLDDALPNRLAGDPRVISAAVRWLAKHARIHIADIHDPHVADEHAAGDQKPADQENAAAADVTEGAKPEAEKTNDVTIDAPDVSDESASPPEVIDSGATPTVESEESSPPSSDSLPSTGDAPVAEPPSDSDATVSVPTAAETSESVVTEPAVTEPVVTEPVVTEPVVTQSAETVTPSEPSLAPSDAAAIPQPSKKQKTGKTRSAKKAAKESRKPKKKISPRQRRRRWLVSVLKPLAGKRIAANKLSAFQVVMLGRALRSQVAQCAFEYDATKLVAELQRTVGGFNRHLSEKLSALVLEHEANIREAAEAAWWDELHEKASSRLVGIAAEHLRRHVNRGNVDAQVVMSIDAVGPRTAATAIVASDGRLLHCEDLPCQMSQALRSQSVARMGELIHTYHVDLIVISNGPSRRACMVATGDLIAQSPEKSIRWTLSDRSGADVYAASEVGDQEMRGTPRRFRAAAWLAFSVLQPAQAFTKVDPLKLRLASFQRELSDDALSDTLESIMVSGASRGGVDANSASVAWLERLPGVTPDMAKAIDLSRRESLFRSREAISELEQWESTVESRQALPFLRVFDSDEVLDGTLIHPDDYVLAKKLASALEIEMPPAAPPGYQPPNYAPEPPESKSGESQPKPELHVEEVVADESTSELDQPMSEVSEESGDSSSASPSDGESAVSEPSAEAAPAETATESADEDQNAPSSAETVDVAAEPEGEPNTGDDSESAVESESASESDALSTAAVADQSNADSSESESAAKAAAPAAPPEPVRRPKPERSKIDKCIKEWQVGSRRVNQLVHWLCDPFGDSDESGRPPAVLSAMPSIKVLKPGEQVIGVVVGVMPFGVFVELAPDCSGLIHVSKVSDAFVEDVHEALQVGDVVTAWVTGVDDKRRRVALSAVSPEREAELREIKQDRDTSGPRGSFRGGQARGGQAGRGDSRGQAGAGQARGGQARGGQARGGQSRGNEQRSGDARGKSSPPPRGGPRRDSRGGHSRDARGGKGRGREKKPESYRVGSSEPAAPISDAMKKGDEPLRSFGDLLQFYEKKEEPVTQESSGASSSEVAIDKPQTEPAGENAAQEVKPEPKSDEVANQTESLSDATNAGTASGGATEPDAASTDEATSDSTNTTNPSDSAQATAEDGAGEDKPSGQSAPTDASTS